MQNLTRRIALGALLASAIAYAHLQAPSSSYTRGAGMGSNAHLNRESVDDGSSTPPETLAYAREDNFTTVKHPYFPEYQVRVKKTKFCDEGVE